VQRILAALAVATALACVAGSPGAGASPEAIDSVANGSFENGLSGWTAVGEASPCPWATITGGTTSFVCHAGYGFAEPAPVDGASFVSTDFDRSSSAAPAEATLSQQLAIDSHGESTLSWSDFLSWDLATYGAAAPRTVAVELRNSSGTAVLATLYRRVIEPGTADFGTLGWESHAVNVTRFAGCDVTLAFVLSMPEVATGPATYSLDAVSLESKSFGATPPSRAGRCD
jgi:hypothetical protein